MLLDVVVLVERLTAIGGSWGSNGRDMKEDAYIVRYEAGSLRELRARAQCESLWRSPSWVTVVVSLIGRVEKRGDAHVRFELGGRTSLSINALSKSCCYNEYRKSS